MSLKITAKILLTLTTIEIITLFSGLTFMARTQNIYASTPISTESVNEATNIFQQGQAKAEQQDYRGAIADFTQAIQLNPNEADFYYQRGLILARLEDQEGAIKDFDDAILRNPSHSWAYFHRAGISFDLGFNSRAILDLRTARLLFDKQENQEGYQKANSLIQHFAGSLEKQTNNEF